jgi:invasion protein IalB
MRTIAPILCAGLFGWTAAAAEAPEAAVEAAMASEEAFQDWTLRCGDLCTLKTELRGTDGARVLVLALAPAETGYLRLTVATALPLFLPEGLSVAAGTGAPDNYPWTTCNAEGCEAWLPVEDDLLAALRRERTATIAFTLVDGTRVRLAASLMGFTAGERALRTQAAP